MEQGISLCENGPFYVARRSTGKFPAVAQVHMPLIVSLKLTSASNQKTFSYLHTVFHETFDSTKGHYSISIIRTFLSWPNRILSCWGYIPVFYLDTLSEMRYQKKFNFCEGIENIWKRQARLSGSVMKRQRKWSPTNLISTRTILR